jgi:hypothetical protein
MITFGIRNSLFKICLIMAKAAHRISVVRVQRLVVNHTNSNEFHDYTDKDITSSNLTPSILPRIDEPSAKIKTQKVREKYVFSLN